MNDLQAKPGKFIDPLSDWGFRYYFGSEPNKEILIEFLNDLFEGEKQITELEYGPTEHDGEEGADKRVIFDLHCRGNSGEYFIVEMQRIRQEYFKDRALYYTSRLIQRQLPKGKAFNSYKLPEVFLIAVLEFRMDGEKGEQYFHNIVLADKQTGEVFYPKLGFKFLELPNFVKEEGQLVRERDKWFYLLKHLSQLDKMPKFLDKRVFKLIFQIGEVSKLKKEERMAYEASLKAKWDTQNAFDTVKREGLRQGLEEGLEKGLEKGRKEGLKEGLKEGRKEGLEKGLKEGLKEGEHKKAMAVAKQLIEMKLSVEDVSKATGLPVEEIKKLK